ncbi:MAG: HEPN domain-containing protein [Methyloprofundus sp.]|nr:HEPN domain-containing protein [Methyloprofundus sp.]
MTKTNLEFCRQNKLACMLLLTAAEDYAAARCCLIGGLFSGLQLASQSVEKLIKASILLHHPEADIRRQYGHDVPSLLKGLESILKQQFDPKYHQIADKLLLHYNGRYPDNPNRAMSASNTELDGIDELCFFLTSELKLPSELKNRVGILGRISNDSTHGPEHLWITQHNQFFNA